MATYSLARDGEKQLSERFKVKEFASPGSDTIIIDDKLVPMLQALADKAGAAKAIISDGYRTAAYNSSVRGSATSQHLFGKAADITFYLPSGTQIPAKTMCQIAERMGVLGIEQISSTYAHFDLRTEQWFAVQGALSASGARTYTTVKTFLTDSAIVPGTVTNTPTLRIGSTGAPVETLQKRLNELRSAGASTMKVDGIFGALTEAYVKSFQTSRGLKSDGIVGPATWEKINQK